MRGIKRFPLTVEHFENIALRINVHEIINLMYRRPEHINIHRLKSFQLKSMVHGLLKVKDLLTLVKDVLMESITNNLF